MQAQFADDLRFVEFTRTICLQHETEVIIRRSVQCRTRLPNGVRVNQRDVGINRRLLVIVINDRSFDFFPRQNDIMIQLTVAPQVVDIVWIVA